MRGCFNSKIHISSNFIFSICLLIMFITLQHLATLNHTTPNYTSLHLSTLHFVSFTLHYSPINISYRSISPHITKLDTVRFSHPQTYFQSNEPLHCPKELLTISLHFTFLFSILFIYFIYFSYQTFTSLYFAIRIYKSLPFTSLAFTFYFLSPSLPPMFYNFLTFVLKIQHYEHEELNRKPWKSLL